jgi:hypothetical protein
LSHDKAIFNILRLRKESLEDSDNLYDTDVLTQEIVDDLEAARDRAATSVALRLGGRK